MSRTLGALDTKQRSGRSDKGKRRKLYRGKPVKSKRQIVYARRRGNKTHLKLWLWKYVAMSKDGRMRWKKYLRPYASPFVCPADMRLRIDMPITEIDTKVKMEQMVAENMPNGTYYVMGLSNAKTKKHVKWVKICKVVVKETRHGNIGHMVRNYRLSRYSWFYKG